MPAGPLFCGPKSKYPFTGYWDYGFQCDFPWKDPPEYCPDYPGQKGGRYDNSEPVENRNNRTDVEGCCWWGRGVIQTTGICNFGILNYYLGRCIFLIRCCRSYRKSYLLSYFFSIHLS